MHLPATTDKHVLPPQVHMNKITCPTPPHPTRAYMHLPAATDKHVLPPQVHMDVITCPNPPHPTPPMCTKHHGLLKAVVQLYIYICIYTSVKQILDWEMRQLFLSQTHHLHEFACKGRTMANFNGLKQNIGCEKRLGVISAHLWQFYLPFPGFLHLNGLDFITIFYLIFGLYKNNTNWTK